MMRLIYSIATLFIILLCVSCQQLAERNIAYKAIQRASSIIEQQPDSALAELQTVLFPEKLGKPEQMNYWLLLIKAKDKTKENISSDTVIAEVKQYFIKKENWEKAATAAFYHGRVLHSQHRIQQAIQAFLEAEHLAEQTNDYTLKGRIEHNIGGLYYNQDDYEKAIGRLKEASALFQKAENHSNNISSLKMIGNCFLCLKQIDSALYYYQKGLEITVTQKDTFQQVSILHNISVLFRRIGSLDKARAYLDQMASLSFREENKVLSYLNYANFYKACNLPDSAMLYAQKALKYLKENDISKTTTAASVYDLLYKLEKEKQHYQQALDYLLGYTETLTKIYQKNKEQSVAGIREKYEVEVLKNSNQRLQFEKQKILLWSLCLLLFIIAITFYIYWRYSRHKKKVLEIQKEAYALKEQLDENYSGKAHAVKGLLRQRFDILKKIALMESYLKEDDKGLALIRRIITIVCGTESGNFWDAFYKTTNELHDGLLDSLLQKYPNLDEQESKICCLSIAEFSNKDIANLLDITVRLVEWKKSSIRKKLQIEERGNIKDFLTEKQAAKEPQ